MIGVALIEFSSLVVSGLFSVAALIFLIAAMFLWNRSPRWIPCLLGATTIAIFLFLAKILLTQHNSTNKSLACTVLTFLPWMDLLFIIVVPVVILGMTIQIMRMEPPKNNFLTGIDTCINPDKS